MLDYPERVSIGIEIRAAILHEYYFFAFAVLLKWKRSVRSTISVAAILSSAAVFAGGFDYAGAIGRIASDIANLKSTFPQLKNFSVAENANADELRISYGYHTHKPDGLAGWTAGVPNPDEDGIWFYIDFHEVDSTAQIHTQPITRPFCIGNKRVSFLSLEGRHTKPMDEAIFKILEKHGAKMRPIAPSTMLDRTPQKRRLAGLRP
jgi:hypothetical protein